MRRPTQPERDQSEDRWELAAGHDDRQEPLRAGIRDISRLVAILALVAIVAVGIAVCLLLFAG